MKRRTQNRFQPSVASLDRRCLLSAGVTASLSGSTLTIRGTEGADAIDVNVAPLNAYYGTISIDGVTRQYKTYQVRTIVIDGQGGNDTIAIHDPGRWPGTSASPRTSILGGAGNDTIFGSAWADNIDGGDGDDVLWGLGGTDTLTGGAGLDTIEGVVEQATPPPPTQDPTTPTNPPVTQDPTAPTLSAIEQRIVDLTNLERQKNGLAPLRVNAKLLDAARLQANNMATYQTMSHTITQAAQPTLGSRIAYVGYDYRAVGENIAYGYSSADSVVAAWMASPGHRANILNATFTEIGVGVAYDGAGRPYYCQVFGTPA